MSRVPSAAKQEWNKQCVITVCQEPLTIQLKHLHKLSKSTRLQKLVGDINYVLSFSLRLTLLYYFCYHLHLVFKTIVLMLHALISSFWTKKFLKSQKCFVVLCVFTHLYIRISSSKKSTAPSSSKKSAPRTARAGSSQPPWARPGPPWRDLEKTKSAKENVVERRGKRLKKPIRVEEQRKSDGYSFKKSKKKIWLDVVFLFFATLFFLLSPFGWIILVNGDWNSHEKSWFL